MARPEGFEPPAFRIGICCDIQLRYGRILKLSMIIPRRPTNFNPCFWWKSCNLKDAVLVQHEYCILLRPVHPYTAKTPYTQIFSPALIWFRTVDSRPICRDLPFPIDFKKGPRLEALVLILRSRSIVLPPSIFDHIFSYRGH